MNAATAAGRAETARIAWPAVALTALLAVLAIDFVLLAGAARTILPYPYNIDYGEGIVWQQMINIAAGRGYAPIGVFPAIVYHYPPLYHLTVAALASLSGGDPLFVGRLTSLLATAGSALIVALLAHRALRPLAGPRTRLVGALLAGLLFPACQPVAEWAPTMRVDMLACLFSLGGLLLTLAALERPRLIVVAAAAFVLGVYTKQVAIAAPGAAILGLLTTRPRLGLACLAACLAFGLAALTVLELATDGGFLRHVILYNINRNELHRLASLAGPIRDHAAFLALAAIGAFCASRARADPTSRILLLYLAFKTAMLAMIMKSGGSSNYLIEWFAPVAIFAAIGAAPAIALATGKRPACPAPVPPRAIGALLAVAACQALLLGQWGDFADAARARATKLDRLVAAIRHSPAPVIADDMTLLIRAGRPVEWEPSIAAELASVGRYDQPRFVAMVRRRCFAGFVTDGDRGDTVFDSRYNPPVAAAMDDAYPRRFAYAGLLLHLPPHGLAARDCGTVR